MLALQLIHVSKWGPCDRYLHIYACLIHLVLNPAEYIGKTKSTIAADVLAPLISDTAEQM